MSLPKTGFESRHHNYPWTTFQEEAEYREALLSAVPSIGHRVIGAGSQDTPMHLYSLGKGQSHVFILAQVHGNEVSGRDALLSLIRDWSQDADMEGYLGQVTLHILPTGNPDTLEQRHTLADGNTNRDYLALSEPETRAIQSVIRDYSPELIVDVHEGRNITQQQATSRMLNPNIHESLLDLSADLEEHVWDRLDDNGYTWERYQDHNITGLDYCHNHAGIRHAVGLLLESRRVNDNSWRTKTRFDTQVASLRAVIEWHKANLTALRDASEASRGWSQGAVPEVAFRFNTDSSGPTVSPPPESYAVGEKAYDDLAHQRDLFLLNFEEPDPHGIRRLSARGDQQMVIHHLVNPLSPNLVAPSSPILPLTLERSLAIHNHQAVTFAESDGVVRSGTMSLTEEGA